MALRSRIKPVDVQLVFRTDGLLSPERISKAIADFASKQFLEVDRKNAQLYGRSLNSEVFVDGVRGGDIYRVRPNGVIVYEWDLANDIVVWCYEQILKASPKKSGRYSQSHRVYADGVEVEDLLQARSVDEWIITTIVPYARKLEGTAGEKYMSSQAPDGIYQAVAGLATARYGNVAKIKFTYRQPLSPSSMLDDWAMRNASKVPGGSAKQRRRYMRNIRQPSISITFR